MSNICVIERYATLTEPFKYLAAFQEGKVLSLMQSRKNGLCLPQAARRRGCVPSAQGFGEQNNIFGIVKYIYCGGFEITFSWELEGMCGLELFVYLDSAP